MVCSVELHCEVLRKVKLFQSEIPYNSTMTDTAVMQALFTKFQEMWLSGKDAHLSFECHAGQAWVNLRVHLQQPPNHIPQSSHESPGLHDCDAVHGGQMLVARNAVAENALAEANHEVVENAAPNENSELAGQADLLPPILADD